VSRFSKPGNPLDAAGAKVGIRFNPSRKVIPTVRIHQLVEYCNKTSPEKSDALMEDLFKKYFEEAVDVSNPDFLVQVATEHGLNPGEAREAINSDAYRSEVMDKVNYARKKLRVTGVPFVMIEDAKSGQPIAFSGAQPPNAIAEMLQEVVEGGV
jgi:predicted DsbA family dithiol-disulfide isomerase